jgi:hypothetical protein
VDVRVANVALGRIGASKEAGNRMAAVSIFQQINFNFKLKFAEKKLIKIL